MESETQINNINNNEKVNNDNKSEISVNNSVSPKLQRHSSISSDSSSAIALRTKISTLLRPSSLVSRVSNRKSKSPPVLVTAPSFDNFEGALVPVDKKTETKEPKRWNTIVTIVLVEARELPDVPDDGSAHNLYCKIRLGSETFKSKSVPNTSQPEWRERFELHLHKDDLLRMSLWDKGRQKNFMGSTVLDLSKLERERTHEIWQQLDDGFGALHFTVTMCQVRSQSVDSKREFDEGVVRAKHAIHNLKSDWRLVGQLHVKVMRAKGLSGKPSAYCTLELDNERVQTHSNRASSEPTWDKSYIFNVYDVTSTLDLKVYDSSLVNAIRSESLGRLSVPLLRIRNREPCWFALKDKNKRNSAKGNCPRVQLEMTMFWNPVKATARLFQPREVKHIKKPPKFDVALVYSNMQFMRDTFNALYTINEHIKRLFEWENQELSFAALVAWLLFWLYFKLWATPLLLLLPFFYYWITKPSLGERSTARSFGSGDDSPEQSDNDKAEKGLTGKIQGLQEMTLTITGGVEYTVSLAERLYHLASFKVPFLSFLTMIFLVVSAISFYFIPFNYTMMAFGTYKFSRKYLNPERILNNDLLDFISRIPDNEILKDWKELSVPEPTLRRQSSLRRRISDSSS